MPPAEVREVGRRHLGVGLGEQRGRACERGRRGVRRAEGVRGPEREHLPPALPCFDEPVDELVCLAAEPPARQRGRMQQDSARARRRPRVRVPHAQTLVAVVRADAYEELLRADALPPLRPAAFFCAVVPPWELELRDLPEPELLPPRLEAPGEFAILAARS